MSKGGVVFFTAVVFALALASQGVADGKYKHDRSFSVPAAMFNDPDFHPVGYLSSFPVADTSAKLDAARRDALRGLFIASACACKAKLRQDYPMGTSAGLYLLLRTNFPRVASVEGEGGKIVMLGRVAEVLQDER